MRYWGLLFAKLGLALAFLGFIWRVVTFLLPAPHLIRNQFFGYDLAWTLAAGLIFLIACGLFYVAILDQRYRCRVCARRLRMPVLTGSWGQMLLLGRPHVEYICPYGHGTLKISELQISGHDSPGWTKNGDMWDELVSSEDKQK